MFYSQIGQGALVEEGVVGRLQVVALVAKDPALPVRKGERCCRQEFKNTLKNKKT